MTSLRLEMSAVTPVRPDAEITSSAPGRQEFRRMEYKFLVDPRRRETVSAWLSHACLPAPEFPVGRVTSCYYDTRDWDSYFESIDGDFSKQKIRLRWYDALPWSGLATAFLEAKEKEGFETWKRRVQLDLDASPLRNRELSVALPNTALQLALADLGVFDAPGLLPAVLISYRRERFVEPVSGLRLALDSEIEAYQLRHGTNWPMTRLPSVVLEVKGRFTELPLKLRGLKRFAEVWSAHSKYSLAVEALAGGIGPLSP